MGAASPTAYPEKPCTLRPAVWLSRPTQFHGMLASEFIFGHLPGLQPSIDISVEVEHALFNKPQGGQCRNRFADGPSLKKRVR